MGRLFLIVMGLEWPGPMLPTTEQVYSEDAANTREARPRGRERDVVLFGLRNPALPPLIHEPISPSMASNSLRWFLSQPRIPENTLGNIQK